MPEVLPLTTGMETTGFAASAYDALMDMRARTSALLADVSTTTTRGSAVHRIGRALVTVTRLARQWRKARGLSALRGEADCIVLYSARTPPKPQETDREFVERVTRSNRDKSLPALLALAPDARILTLEVRAGLDTSATAPSVLDYVLAQFSPWAVLRLIAECLRHPRAAARTASARGIEQLNTALRQADTDVVMLTSNSLLAEFLRLACCRRTEGRIVEVLHGIASVGMEGYYDFINAHADVPPVYVNLIAGLRHFPSIEQHLLRDERGEVAVNAHIWARLGPDGVLTVPQALAARQPLVVIGGTASGDDYYASKFFASECRLLEAARRHLPGHTIVYCPHPANRASDTLAARLADNEVTLSPMPTFGMLFCAGSVVGTYSTSLFEAALLGKRVFLLPFDHAMLMPELIEDVDFARSAASLEEDFARFLRGLPGRPDGESVEQLSRAARQRLGLQLRFEHT